MMLLSTVRPKMEYRLKYAVVVILLVLASSVPGAYADGGEGSATADGDHSSAGTDCSYLTFFIPMLVPVVAKIQI